MSRRLTLEERIQGSQEVFKIFDNLSLTHLLTLIMTCVPLFVAVCCHVVESVLKPRAYNLNICRDCLLCYSIFRI